MTLVAKKSGGDSVLPDNFLELQATLVMLSPIHSKSDYTKALKVAGMLAPRNDLTKSQTDYLGSLVNNVESYEKERFSDNNHNPLDLLQFLLDENQLNGSDLGRILGNRTLGYAILKEQRQLSKSHIVKLAEHFSVSPALFI